MRSTGQGKRLFLCLAVLAPIVQRCFLEGRVWTMCVEEIGNVAGCSLLGPVVADILENEEVVGTDLWLLNYLFGLVLSLVHQTRVHMVDWVLAVGHTTVTDQLHVLSCCSILLCFSSCRVMLFCVAPFPNCLEIQWSQYWETKRRLRQLFVSSNDL